jgi:GNAT superfamily N-acetyltransferase
VSNASKYDEEVDLASGERVRIRAIRPTDKDGLLGLFQALSPRSVYSRFLYRKKDVSPEQLKYFTELDFDNHVALVATIGPDQGEDIIGVGRYVISETESSPRCAEIAIAVADEHQRQGVGHALLERLASIGAAAGLEQFEAVVHGSDGALLRLFEHSGFEVDERTDSGRIQVVLDLKHPRAKSAK